MMKKILTLALCAVMMLSVLAGCGGKTDTPAANDTPAQNEPAAPAENTPDAPEAGGTIGVCIYQFTDAFMTTYRNALQEILEGKGYTVTVVDGANDQAKQNEQINTFITQGVDALIINPVMTSAADQIISTVKNAGIPTVLINREPTAEQMAVYDKLVYVGALAAQSGTMQGELILDTPNQGDINGDGKISYIMVQGDPENIDAQYRTEFSIKALDDAGITSECLLTSVGNWDQGKGQEITASALTQFGTDLDVVFCNNDGMALGAATAIEAAGRKVGEDILLVGVDALDEAVERIGNGTMTGTVLNDHIGQSHKAVDVAIAALNGEAIDNYYWVDYVKVDLAYVENQG